MKYLFMYLSFFFVLFYRLQAISDQITTNGCVCPSVFSSFTNLVVQQAVVSSRHIAFLLQVNILLIIVVYNNKYGFVFVMIRMVVFAEYHFAFKLKKSNQFQRKQQNVNQNI